VNSPSHRRLAQFSLASLFLLLTAAAVSSGIYAWIVERRGAAHLEGLITMNGQPLKDCLVVLTPITNDPKPRSYSAKLDNAGRYEFPYEEELRSGVYHVSIQSSGTAAPGVSIPAVYSSHTALVISLQEGENQVNLELQN
jgi:hypothetical protein